ncbi:ABC transporter ATP-binding protein [Natrinema pallidum]|uniref:ABC transporter ATP-binding protein n=1 Tax=Natrinema pallidum TaxID=69527 RepID=A0A4P9TGE3_9EURY|nr:ABC transporter ATP-binding protein [Natrinema pallidum]QCW02942.1 ABC transporter ATP-binding protein [Natrinema pallidum]
MEVVETQNLRKEFSGGIVAVDDLSFSINEGEIFGLLGPNGAGKSTVINILLGFVTPSAGHATVLDQDVQRDFASTRNRIGILPEGYSLYDRLTAREHIEWVIRTKNGETTPHSILERVGINDVADRRVGGFSKGMRQRLAFGMALVGDPDLLVLDEPSSGLDPAGIQEMRNTIRKAAANGTTVVFSSHVLPEVEAVCDRVGIMSDGQLVALDSIDTLRDQVRDTARIVLTLEEVPDNIGLRHVDGVRKVTVDGTEIRVDCHNATVKADVVRHIDQRATISDIISEKSSLEVLFNKYTDNLTADDGHPTAEVAQ